MCVCDRRMKVVNLNAEKEFPFHILWYLCLFVCMLHCYPLLALSKDFFLPL